MTLTAVLLLYICFRVKQVTCDFLLQTEWMALNKGNPGWSGYKPLFAHAVSHSVSTLIIFLIFAPGLWWFCFIDLFVHSFVDRVRALLNKRQKWTPEDWKFWWSFGLDQEVHNFTHLVYILIIIAKMGGVTV